MSWLGTDGVAANIKITVNGKTILAPRGAVLLDAAQAGGMDLPYDCRAGFCGTCCLRLIAGAVQGGEGAEPGIVHACQCRISEDSVFETRASSIVRAVHGEVASLRPLSAEVVEVGIRTTRFLPHHQGQYVRLEFDGFPSRPYSISLPITPGADSRLTWFHIRRLKGGKVSAAVGESIRLGHRVVLTGPFGSAYFRPARTARTVLVATNTGFAPIWAIAAAALRENPTRIMRVIAGGRSLHALYMGPALMRLARFPNVQVVPVCSGTETRPEGVLSGRPTDYIPQLLSGDVVYACGAPGMVEAVKSIAASQGAVCHADPFQTETAKQPMQKNSRTVTAIDPERWAASVA